MTFRCDQCLTLFQALLDHGKPRRFCSRDCFRAKAKARTERACEQCGNIFIPRNDQRHKYCSNQCRADSKLKGQLEQCLWCRNQFYRPPSNHHKCCSKACAKEFYKEDRSPAYEKGFYMHSQHNEKHVLLHREGWVSEYIGEHRLIAVNAIGRMLTRREYVIRLNRNPLDNSEDNLFICDISEFCRMNKGSLPWPTKSNLLEYERGMNSNG